MDDRMDFYVKELKKVAGWTISNAVRTPKGVENIDDCFGIELTSPDKKKTVVMWILADNEGNGPGSFEIDEH